MNVEPKLVLESLGVCYGRREAVRDLSLSIPAGSIYAVIGPAASGKTSLLRTINLLSLDIDQARVTGRILLDGHNLLDADVDHPRLRRRIGLVTATPQPLPGSIHRNLTFGPRLAGRTRRDELDALVESALRSANLWDEVKDRLRSPASALSGGQQQRLCIARAIALSPEVILLDEPCSGLDPISTARIEEMMRALQTRFTWVIVTNNTKQAARVSDRTAFMLSGTLVEEGPTGRVFTAPTDARTAAYVEGRFG